MNQVWYQNFNPLGNSFLSTAAAAIPVCTLFYFLAVRRTAAWLSAVYAFRRGAGGGAGRLPHARPHGGGRGGGRAGLRLVPHCLDRGGRGVRLRALGGFGLLRNHQALGGQHLARPAPAGAAHRLRLRRADGRRGRRRRARGHHRRHDDRPGLPAVSDRAALPHRQLRAGGVRRHGQSGAHAGCGHRAFRRRISAPCSAASSRLPP